MSGLEHVIHSTEIWKWNPTPKMHDNTHFVINHVTRHHFYTNILFKQQNDWEPGNKRERKRIIPLKFGNE